MEPVNEEIASITSAVWGSVLNLAVESDLREEEPQPGVGLAFIGSVQIRGAWEGAVLVHAPGGLVRRAAAIMFGLEESEIGSNEMSDALGELTNMVGGNVKALLPAPCKLSLPTVVEGIEPRLVVLGNQLVRRVGFVSEGHSFAVAILKLMRA